MSGEESSYVFSRESERAKPKRGGTTKCSRCDQPRMPSLAYCREHHAAYQREWRRRRAEEFERLRALADGGTHD